MRKEIADLWIKALRSGDYEQGRLYLNADGKFCCLGVLCEVAIKSNVHISHYKTNRTMIQQYDGYIASLPMSINEWSGIKTGNGAFIDDHSLAGANDFEGKDFDEIAELIEHYWSIL